MENIYYIIAFDYGRKGYETTYFNYVDGQTRNRNEAFKYIDDGVAIDIYNKIQDVQHSPYLMEKNKVFGNRVLGNMTDRKISVLSIETSSGVVTEIQNNFI